MSGFITIATHNGAFHADDVFGVAVLLVRYPDATVIRTRDAERIAQADFAVDVGGVWDAAAGRFDHHQKGFCGARDNGTVYASAGLVWAEHGRACIRIVDPHLPQDIIEKAWAGIDRELVEHLDRADTGAAQGAPDYFGLSALVSAFNVTRREDDDARAVYGGTAEQNARMAASMREARFLEAVRVVQALLRRLVAQFGSQYRDERLVRESRREEGGAVLVLAHSGMHWEQVVVTEMPEVRFVVYPDSSDAQHQVRTVPVAVGSFTARLDLPAAWAGLRDGQLAEVSGVPDAVFCHNGRFIGGAVSLEGALSMARLALSR